MLSQKAKPGALAGIGTAKLSSAYDDIAARSAADKPWGDLFDFEVMLNHMLFPTGKSSSNINSSSISLKPPPEDLEVGNELTY